MSERPLQHAKWATVSASVAAVPLMLLANACGNIHGSPNCGPVSFLPLLVVVPALAVESSLFESTPNSWAFLVIFGVVAFVMVWAMVFVALSVVDLVRTRS